MSNHLITPVYYLNDQNKNYKVLFGALMVNFFNAKRKRNFFLNKNVCF